MKIERQSRRRKKRKWRRLQKKIHILGRIIIAYFSQEGFISLDFIPNSIEVKRICMHNELELNGGQKYEKKTKTKTKKCVAQFWRKFIAYSIHFEKYFPTIFMMSKSFHHHCNDVKLLGSIGRKNPIMWRKLSSFIQKHLFIAWVSARLYGI